MGGWALTGTYSYRLSAGTLPGGPIIYVSPNGPDQYGLYGANTKSTTTSGIQEAINAANTVGGGTVVLRASLGALTISTGINLTPWTTLTSDLPAARKPKTSGNNIGKPDIILAAGFVGVAPYPGYTAPSGGGQNRCVIGTDPTENYASGGYGIGTLIIDCTAATNPVDGVHFTNVSRSSVGYLGISGCATGFSSETYPATGATFGETGQIQIALGMEFSNHTGVGVDLQNTTQFCCGALIQSVQAGSYAVRIQSSSKCQILALQANNYTYGGVIFDDANGSCANNEVANAVLTGGTGSAWSSATAYVIGNTVTSGGDTYVCIANNTNEVPPNATYWQLVYDIYALFSGAKSGSVGNVVYASVTTGGVNALSFPANMGGTVSTKGQRYITLDNVVGVTDQSLVLAPAQPSVPASTTKQFNHYPFPVAIYINETGTGVSAVAMNGTTIYSQSSAAGRFAVVLNPEDFVTLTYATTTPGWVWMAVN